MMAHPVSPHITASPVNTISKSWLLALAVSLLAGIGLATYTGHLAFLILPWVTFFIFLVSANINNLFWLFLLTIPFSVEIEITSGLTLTLPDEPLMVGILGVVICTLVYNYRIFPEWFWKSPIILIIFLQYIWTVITVLFAQDILLASKYLLAKSWFLASFVMFAAVFIRSKKDIKTIFLIIAVPTVLQSVVAFIWHYKLNFGYAASNKVVFPFFENHVDYGSVLSMILPVIYIAYTLIKKDKALKYLVLLAAVFLVVAISFAYSRAAILAAVFAGVVYIAVKRKWVNMIIPGMLIFISALIIFLANNDKYLEFRPNKNYNATQETFMATVVGAFTGRDMSSMERFYRWIASVRMSGEHPIVGVGPNNWYYHYKPHTVSAFRTWVSRNEEQSTTHNYFIYMLTEQGWPGMILYTVLIMLLLHIGQKTYHNFKDNTSKQYTMAVTMAIAASFVNNFFSEFLETHKVGGMFYLSVVILAYLHYQSKRSTQKVMNT